MIRSFFFFLSLLILFPLKSFAYYNYQSSNEESKVTITSDGKYKYIYSNSIPNHKTGEFPNKGNPNSIMSQNFNFKIPAYPKLASKITKLGMYPFGIAINGIVFDPFAMEFWNNDPDSGWNYNALSPQMHLGMDDNHAHVQPGGVYHYHGMPIGLINSNEFDPDSNLIGYAADGFPIYAEYGPEEKGSSGMQKELKPSYRLKSGTRPSGPGGKYDGTFVEDYEYVPGYGDLDECNGKNAAEKGSYYYVLSDDFPYVPRCFKGSPDDSFVKSHDHGPGPGGRNGGGNRRGGGFPPPPPRNGFYQGGE